MAVDWRATSGHASLIDDGAICWLSKRQEDVSPTTPKNDHVVVTRGSTEAFWPRSPVSCAFGDFESHHIPFPNHQTSAAFTRDHQYHPPDCTYRHAAQLDPGGLEPADNTVADTPNNPPASAKGRHFVASLGLRTK